MSNTLATQKAIVTATAKEAEENGKPKTTHFSITFGTLTFNINLDDDDGQNQSNKPLPKTTHGDSLKQNYKRKETKPTNFTVNPSPQDKYRTNKNSEKIEDKIHRNTAQVTATQRFVKAPPATGDWKQAVRKKRNIRTQKKRCFYCQKLGHIQKFCRKKIKCYSCGRRGHKYANCFYKLVRTPPDPNLNQNSPPQHQHHGNPMARSHRLSSTASSSRNTPSEPTIDLSAWSPRSFRSLPKTIPTTFSKPRLKWHPKSSVNQTAPLLSDHRLHDDFHTKATENPSNNFHTQQIYFLKCICLLVIPRPVRSNPLSLLFLTATAQIRTTGGDEKGSRSAMLEVCYPLL